MAHKGDKHRNLLAEVVYMQIGEIDYAWTIYVKHHHDKKRLEKRLELYLKTNKIVSFSGQGEILIEKYAIYEIEDFPASRNSINFLSDMDPDKIKNAIKAVCCKHFKKFNAKLFVTDSYPYFNPFKNIVRGEKSGLYKAFEAFDDTEYNEDFFSIEKVFRIRSESP